MWESARALIAEYPSEFNEQNQSEHIEDLLSRFCNRALGDTIYRVGRDVTRKLGRQDRVIGPLLLEIEHGAPTEMTALCAAAGMRFLAKDDKGETYPPDAQFATEVFAKGPQHVLRDVCGLDPANPADRIAYDAVLAANAALEQRMAQGESILQSLSARPRLNR